MDRNLLYIAILMVGLVIILGLSKAIPNWGSWYSFIGIGIIVLLVLVIVVRLVAKKKKILSPPFAFTHISSVTFNG